LIPLSDPFYRPGLIFHSPFSAYQFIVRPNVKNYGPDGVTQIGELRELVAEFAYHRGEYTYTDSDGNTQVAADIAGHYFDLDAQAEQKGWTDEEKEYVANKLTRACVQFPGEVRLYTKAPAPKPWAKYDETHHSQVATIAETTGFVAEALLYEKENKARKSVIADLEALIEAPVVEDELAAV